jgi:hypothetical protein
MSDLRARFLGEVKARVGKAEVPPEKLLDEMRAVAYGEPDVYLRKGQEVPNQYLETMGGLKRAVSLKSALFSLTNDAFYRSAWDADQGGLPPDRSGLDWKKHADRLVQLVRSGRIPFDPARHLDPSALVQGPTKGSSGWYFAAADVGTATSSPEML